MFSHIGHFISGKSIFIIFDFYAKNYFSFIFNDILIILCSCFIKFSFKEILTPQEQEKIENEERKKEQRILRRKKLLEEKAKSKEKNDNDIKFEVKKEEKNEEEENVEEENEEEDANELKVSFIQSFINFFKKIFSSILDYICSPFFIQHFCRVGAIIWLISYRNVFCLLLLAWLFCSFVFIDLGKIKNVTLYCAFPCLLISSILFHITNIVVFQPPFDIQGNNKYSLIALRKFNIRLLEYPCIHALILAFFVFFKVFFYRNCHLF